MVSSFMLQYSSSLKIWKAQAFWFFGFWFVFFSFDLGDLHILKTYFLTRCLKTYSFEEKAACLVINSCKNISLPMFYCCILLLYKCCNSFLKIAKMFVIFLQGIENIKNEIEDATEPLIDPVYGHGR